MNNATVIYYTSNREYESFENAIKQNIIEAKGDLPLISVSQKPIDFGTNICVGNIRASKLNICKQLLIGAMHVETEFVIPVEADILYPPDFFTFSPERDDTFYYAKDAYIIWHGKEIFWRKKMYEFTGIVAKNHLIKMLYLLIDNLKGHFTTTLRKNSKQETFVTDAPLITIKTDRQLHNRHPHSKVGYENELPLWGTSKELWTKYPLE